MMDKRTGKKEKQKKQPKIDETIGTPEKQPIIPLKPTNTHQKK